MIGLSLSPSGVAPLSLPGPGAAAPEPGAPPLTVFAVIGQSNAVGFAQDTGGSTSAYPAGTLHWASAGGWDPVPSRIDHGPDAAGEFRRTGEANPNFGWDRAFAESWAAANPGAAIGLVGAAKGGSGFADGYWLSAGAGYVTAVARINAAMAAAPAGSVFGGFLWHQGENDAAQSAEAAYQGHLLTLIDGLRADVTAAGPATPFVAGCISQASGGSFFHARIAAAQMALGNLRTHCAFASAPPGGTDNGDGTHYDPETADRFGPRFAAALLRAEANTALSAGGAVPVVGTVQSYVDPVDQSDWTVPGVAADGADLLVFAISARVAFNGEPWQVSWAGIPADPTVVDRGYRMAKIYTCAVPPGVSSGDFNVRFRATGSPTAFTEAILTVIPVRNVRPGLSGDLGWKGQNAGNTAAISLTPTARAGDLVLAFGGAQGTAGGTGSFDLAGAAPTSQATSTYITTVGYEIAGADGPVPLTHTLSSSYLYHSVQAICLRPL